MDVEKELERHARRLLVLLRIVLAMSVAVFVAVIFWLKAESDQTIAKATIAKPQGEKTHNYWHAPAISVVQNETQRQQLEYGKDLIAHTSKYFGPQGSIKHITNGLNCQNCHLDAGTKTFGNNYGTVGATYPKYRARSGQVESIEKRVNDWLVVR